MNDFSFAVYFMAKDGNYHELMRYSESERHEEETRIANKNASSGYQRYIIRDL